MRRNEQKPLTAADRHVKAFTDNLEWADIAMAVCNAWGRGEGTAQSCMLLGLKAAYEMGRVNETIRLDRFREHCPELTLSAQAPTYSSDDEDEPSDDGHSEDAKEDWANRLARLAAEVKAKKRKRVSK